MEKNKSGFSHFFKEKDNLTRDILQESPDHESSKNPGIEIKKSLPKLPERIEATEENLRTQWNTLRSFFSNGNNTEGLPDGLQPVVMSPLYTADVVGMDFPLWINIGNEDNDYPFCVPLHQILTTTISSLDENQNDLKILIQNIDRIIHIANANLDAKEPQLFHPSMASILDTLESQLDIGGESLKVFRSDLENLKKALPQNGILLPYSERIVFQILEAAMTAVHSSARENLRNDIHDLRIRLEDLLSVEKEKSPEGKDPETLKDSYSFANSMLKFEELSSILPEAGSEIMEPERLQRISLVVDTLKNAASIIEQRSFIAVNNALLNAIDQDNIFENTSITGCKPAEGSETIEAMFHEQIRPWTQVFVAMRIGELELEDRYQPDVHDRFFQEFNWENFSEEELAACPHFMLIADARHLFDTEYNKLSSMLSANIPVKILGLKGEVDAEKHVSSSGASYGLHTHPELASLLFSHKNIYISQSSAVTPVTLFEGFKEGMAAFAPAFFHVLNINGQHRENPMLWSSAIIESRDFPGFTYKGLLGTPWGNRFDVGNNPQPAKIWPVHTLGIIDTQGEEADMEFPFTFADQAVLYPAYQKYYLLTEASAWNNDLVPITEYLERDMQENIGAVPFIWMIDDTNTLQKVAVSWNIVIATQERRDFWRFLQENSGIDNYHVMQAVEKTREELQEHYAGEIEQLKAAHALEIEKIREEEAERVMENLTAALLNLDTSQMQQAYPVTRTGNMPAEKAEGEEIVEVETEEEEEVSEEGENAFVSEPYIDTALCTSCNDCININGALFKYNADKMAYIADPRAGTFEEIVRAAEKCPVKIIHPGEPLDPNEPGLEELIERAKPFN